MKIIAFKLKITGSGSFEESFVEKYTFDGYDCNDKLCSWLFRDKSNRYHTVIAHNGCGYDNKFVLNWVISHGIHPNKYIRQGSRITYMTFNNNNLRFIDSLSFVAKPLRDFPKIFSIEEDAKGFFPHHFNTP